MKVLFSNPPWWVGKRKGFHLLRRWTAGVRAGSRWPFTYDVLSSPGRFNRRDYLPYPFFMGYAATWARKHTDAEVHFRDSIALRETYEDYYRLLEEENYDLIFIEIATPSWEHDREVIAEIRRRRPDTGVVVTGPITTSKSEELIQKHGVHACIKGEYEKGSVKVIEGATGILEHDLLTTEEMNAAPFPWYDEQHAHRYWDQNPRGQKWPQAQVWSSRGCPFKCIFCVWPATMTGNDPDGENRRTVRHYTPEYMEAFLSEIVERYDYRSIYFDDDTFNLGNSHVEKMCEVMQRIGLPWSAMCRADTIKHETWRLMKESGCFGVKLGFESGSQAVVDNIVNKHLDLERGAEVVRELKRLGMTVHGTFTYGLPGETREDMLETRRFIESLPFDSVQESGTAEIEGTPLHTLTVQGELPAYAEARLDKNYDRATDGNQKWQSVVKQLRES
ncbi:MAG: radical SAM protein [Phycisphaeraceae bacterium]|nr:radical SAM protein [Phycisphaeraceae bacterium]